MRIYNFVFEIMLTKVDSALTLTVKLIIRVILKILGQKKREK